MSYVPVGVDDDNQLPAPVRAALAGSPELSATFAEKAETYDKGQVDAEISKAAAGPDLRARTRGPLPIRNIQKLSRWEAAQTAKVSPVATFLGHSIVEGVGADNTANTVNYPAFKQYSFPAFVNKKAARARGLRPAHGFVGAMEAFGFARTLGGTTQESGTLGPFGDYASSRPRGGVNLQASGLGYIEWAASELGAFTEVDIISWGQASGLASPRTFGVTIDDVEKIARPTTNVNQAGNLTVTTITGLTDTPHKLRITAGGTSAGTPIVGIVTRRTGGVVVNRIGAAGARTRDAVGYASTVAADKQRQIDSAVLKGYSDLVCIMLTENDRSNNVPPAEAKANLQLLISAAVSGGACVMLMSDPPASTDTAAYPASAYRTILAELSDENDHVAYFDTTLVFGPRATAVADGLFPSSGTVHPNPLGNESTADKILASLPVAAIG